MACLHSQKHHWWQTALLIVPTQDDAVQVVSAFGEVFGRLVTATLVLDFEGTVV